MTFVSYVQLFTAFLLYFTVTNACDKFNFDADSYQFDRDDREAEANDTLHVGSWLGRLTRKIQNYTALTVQWDQPTDTSHLCAYALHYYKGSDVSEAIKHSSKFIQPNTTEYHIEGLEMGRSYHAYVEAVFDVPIAGTGGRTVLKSWILVTSTLGYGPDNPCNCVAQATSSNHADDCDLRSGKCRCKDDFTFGQRCEQCAFRFYMDPEEGCTACDECPSDEHAGDGSCSPDNDFGMKCNCKVGYTGRHCSSCAPGYYKQDKICTACNCSGNEKNSVDDFCDPTGLCIACDYHTAGNHCEVCYPGYVGDALSRTCTLQSHSAKNFGVAVLSIIVIGVTIFLLVVAVRHILRRHRQRHFLSTSKAPSNGSTSGINFTTLVEEPEMDFQSPSRKLQFMGASGKV
jgi:hypothetical protein